MIIECDRKKTMPKKLSPLISRQDYAYDELKRMIVDGVISKEERVVERQVSEALGLSRVPVREALLRLKTEGILVSIPKGGFMVRAYSKDEVVELYQLRDAIESYSAKLAAERGSEEDIRTCIAVHAKLESVRDTGREYSEYDELFHCSILKAGGNTRMSEFFTVLHYQHVCLTLDELGYEMNIYDYLDEVIDSHGKILDAIKAHDGVAASAAMSEHINKAMNSFIIMMEGK